jgi:thiamine-phosphate pyrophosphorylase
MLLKEVLNMKFDKRALLLYAVTDRSWLGEKTLLEQAGEALQGGVTMLQLREKNLGADSFYKEAIEIKELCKKHNVPFIINDDVELAVKCNADGVHVGQSDMEAGKVREKIGDKMLLGVSAQTVEQALLAEERGADYLGVGAVFSTSTKLDADTVSYETLKEICSAVKIPVVAIGGIYPENVLKLSGSGITGIAVVSAIFAAEDIKKASEELKALTERTVNGEDKRSHIRP